MSRIAILGLAVVSVVGCGGPAGPRFDATSEETAEASLEQMLTEMPDQEHADRLTAALLVYGQRCWLRDDPSGGVVDELAAKRIEFNARKELDGLTAEQIIKKVDASPEEAAKALEAHRRSKAYTDAWGENARKVMAVQDEQLMLIDKRGLAKTSREIKELDAEEARLEKERVRLEEERAQIEERYEKDT